ncbi:PaaI family thioesterase [Mycobacterium sp. M26]|uniref:PaaI family thioesterase n=1 Tax=Mycobacterium sp. M26 TaxID=1762962 RepID=UPI00073EAFB5|nr:PaaI family thioesterase [Mycobacterium sp. M26]
MTQRETTVRWRDPAPALTALPALSGIDFMKKMAAGELPGAPMASHFAMDVIDVESGAVTFRCIPDASHYNPVGTVHGGLVCTLLDSALGCATHTTLPAGMGYTSIEIKVNYLRPVAAGTGALTCNGRVTKPGRRVAFAEGEVLDSEGRVVATASGSLLVFPLQDR